MFLITVHWVTSRHFYYPHHVVEADGLNKNKRLFLISVMQWNNKNGMFRWQQRNDCLLNIVKTDTATLS